MEKILISTVTPVYQGEATLDDLVRLLLDEQRSWERQGLPLELVEAIFVDDGSIDDSASVLGLQAERHSWVRVVTLSRNFGQHPATTAGILHSSGDWVVTLDEDLQHEPRFVLPLLREVVERQWDIGYAKPIDRVHESRLRDWGSLAYKSLLARITKNPHVKSFNSFRVIRGSIARAAAAVATHDTYFDVVLGWFSNRLGSLPLPLRDRRYIAERASGYSFSKLLSHARRLLVSSQTKWLRVGAIAGVGALLFSFVLTLFVVGQKLIDPASIEVRGWLSTFLSIAFFGGLSCFLLGVLLEYLSTVVLQVHGKPAFFVVDRTKDAILREHFTQHGTDVSAAPETDVRPTR